MPRIPFKIFDNFHDSESNSPYIFIMTYLRYISMLSVKIRKTILSYIIKTTMLRFKLIMRIACLSHCNPLQSVQALRILHKYRSTTVRTLLRKERHLSYRINVKKQEHIFHSWKINRALINNNILRANDSLEQSRASLLQASLALRKEKKSSEFPN